MTRTTRRVIFYSFVLIFFAVTPPIILYSAGYTYDWQKHKITKTGGFYLKSTPSGAKIIIDDKDSGTTPGLVSRLAPRQHKVVVSKDGFIPWQKNIEILPKTVTEARNIFLFPEKIEPEFIADNATTSLYFYLLSEQDKQKEIIAQRMASTTAGWSRYNNSFFFISEINFTLNQRNLGETTFGQIYKESLPDDTYQIILNNDRRFLLLSQKGTLYFFNRDTNFLKLIAENIDGADFSTDNKKIVFWNNNEIWVYFVEKTGIQPYREPDEKELITRYSQKISAAVFYPNNEYITFVVGNQIKVSELDNRDQRNTNDFLQLPQPEISFNTKDNHLYILTKNTIFRTLLE